MVTELTCYESGDGQLFRSAMEASRHDLELTLLPALKGNIGLVNDLIAAFNEYYPAMVQYQQQLDIHSEVE